MYSIAGGAPTACVLDGAGAISTVVDMRLAVAADLDVACRWLVDAGLPTDDLTSSHMEAFTIAMRGDLPVGMIGLETFGEIGLLRSLVVDSDCRGVGLGRQLVDALEARARDAGITELWLLTIDADSFFSRLGYAVAERSDAPPAIQSSAEFSQLCPADAVLMRRAAALRCC